MGNDHLDGEKGFNNWFNAHFSFFHHHVNVTLWVIHSTCLFRIRSLFVLIETRLHTQDGGAGVRLDSRKVLNQQIEMMGKEIKVLPSPRA